MSFSVLHIYFYIYCYHIATRYITYHLVNKSQIKLILTQNWYSKGLLAMSVALMTKVAHWAFFVFTANLYWSVLIFLFSLPFPSHPFPLFLVRFHIHFNTYWRHLTMSYDALQWHLPMTPSNDTFQWSLPMMLSYNNLVKN